MVLLKNWFISHFFPFVAASELVLPGRFVFYWLLIDSIPPGSSGVIPPDLGGIP